MGRSSHPTITSDPLYNLWARKVIENLKFICSGQNLFHLTELRFKRGQVEHILTMADLKSKPSPTLIIHDLIQYLIKVILPCNGYLKFCLKIIQKLLNVIINLNRQNVSHPMYDCITSLNDIKILHL